MISFALTAASIAVVTIVVGAGLFLKDYRGAQAERADRMAIEQVAKDNYQRWKTERASGEASCQAEIASATELARQEGALQVTSDALARSPKDAEGECGLDSEIRW